MKPTTTTKIQLVGAGMSRAAKKRKKKKSFSTISNEEPRGNEENVETTENYDVSNSKLLKAWISSSPLTKSQPAYLHLKPYLEALSKPLPLTFRLRDGNTTEAMKAIQDDLHTKFGSVVKPYAFGNIFQAKSCHLSKASLTKQSPSLKAFLVQHSSDGTLARQEFGSMLPILGLELKEHSRILDVCASPGSKVLQALEVVGVKGRIVANDVHPTRLETLKAAVMRAGLPLKLTQRVLYTQFDAGIFPTPKNNNLFDAVVCDVPCSGDGTIRKDMHILPLWSPVTGNALHSLQVRILTRALQLVRVGGMVSYSTCSLNPIEDEAVVASVVSRMNAMRHKPKSSSGEVGGPPALELVDFPKLPGFIYRPGIKDWKVADYVGDTQNDQDDDTVSLRWHATYKEATDDDAKKMDKAVPGMWPPSKEDADLMHLERCIRLWPQDQDTGGFFVVLIRKNH
jgi:16S rRNA C967 or C1407 C5-methylase (RsmB/RsmF family)